jgi:hypothetical protein
MALGTSRDEELMKQAVSLAQQCVSADVLENQLAMVLAHLRRQKDLRATAELLRALPASPFAARTKSSRKQIDGLAEHVGRALARVNSWEEAATVVGWAKRLSAYYKPRKS